VDVPVRTDRGPFIREMVAPELIDIPSPLRKPAQDCVALDPVNIQSAQRAHPLLLESDLCADWTLNITSPVDEVLEPSFFPF